MKFLLVTLLIITFTYAEEIDRIDSLVNDINTLRENSSDCKSKVDTGSVEKLKQYKVLLKSEKDKNNILLKEIGSLEKLNKKLNTSSINSDKSDKSSVKLLKDKDLKILSLQSEQKRRLESKDKEIQSLKNQIKISKNKQKVLEKSIENQKVSVVKPKIITKTKKKPVVTVSKNTHAGTYRLKNESTIYNAISGEKIDTWEKDTSFTSSIQKDNWIKITGYFVDKKWQKSQKEIWVKKADAFKR